MKPGSLGLVVAFVGAVTIAVMGANSCSAQQPFFMGLGIATDPEDISADGKVVVGDTPLGSSFRWTRETGKISITQRYGMESVSADGSTMVINSGFRWTSDVGLVQVPLGPNGVSGDGSILVGNGHNTATGQMQAASWTQADGFEIIPLSASDSRYSNAWDVSNDGSVILGTTFDGTLFTWSDSDGVVLLNLPSPLSDDGTFIKISDNGKVVTSIMGVGANRRGFRWTKELGVVEVGRLPNGPWMSATGVSADGSIIVGNSQNVSPQRPAIWDAVHGPRYLDSMLVNEIGLANSLSGWTNLLAYGISGDGRSIIGRGTNPDGFGEGWIAYLGSHAALAGDFNSDGTVDAADYVVWRIGLGTTYTQTDYDTWRANFGQTDASAAAASESAGSANPAVPEPATFALAALAFVSISSLRMRRRRGSVSRMLLVAFAAASAMINANSILAQQPFFMGLGTFGDPGYSFPASVAEDISAEGTVVVGVSTSLAVGGGEPFRWTRETGMVGLGFLSGDGGRISADGSTIAVSQTRCLPCITTHYKWTSDAGLVSVPVAESVSGDGSIFVGNALNPVSGRQQAARWTETGGLQFLPIEHFAYSSADDISADGSVVVGRADASIFTWSSTAGVVMVNLPSPQSGQPSISDDGKVIVGVMGNESAGNRRGFRWTKETGVVEIGKLPDGLWAGGKNISADGSVIVGNTQNVYPQKGYLWDAVHGPRYLDDVLVNDVGLGDALVGWSQLRAGGISADGRTLVGTGYRADRSTEAWIAYLGPAPTFAGDFNQNGMVDAADYIVWRNGLDATYTQTDYNVWRAHFGQTAASASAAPGSAEGFNTAVPEPATFTLLALMLAHFATRWRSSHVST